MPKKSKHKSEQLSKEHNALRFITIDGYTFEKVGIELTNVGWVTTLKMPYYKKVWKKELNRYIWTRFVTFSEKKLKDLLNA
jgi:ribosomal protein S25